MRIHEFAKQIGITSKQALELLTRGGFSFATHMAVLPDDARAYLETTLRKQEEPVKEVEKVVTTVAQPVVMPVPVQKEVKQPHVVQPRPEIQKPKAPGAPTTVRVVSMTVEQFAQQIQRPVNDVILVLLRKGVVAPKNYLLSEKMIPDLARHYGLEPVFETKKERREEDKVSIVAEKGVERLPIVVVMGHVDHGKTTLLDFIRKTRVAAREKGGITQHLGAYQVQTAQGGLVFLDTPGHEAFSHIRVRGTRVADLVVLVVAADDSVKPQTIEALKHAQAMKVPIIVAVNKMDKVDPARIDVVKRDLAQYDLLPEEWGGSTVFVPISAKVGTGVDQLLEMLVLQAQLMELKADIEAPVKGYVLEAKLEKGRGAVATVITQQGTLRIGDFFICGDTQGKVTVMTDSSAHRVDEVAPSVPVQVSGFDGLAQAGDVFEGVSQDLYRRAREGKTGRRTAMPQRVYDADTVALIVKADNASSQEAVVRGLDKLSEKGDKRFYVVSSSIGDITEGDVTLAATTGALIVGLHVRVEQNAITVAQSSGVSIELFDIIYKLFDALKDRIKKARVIPTVRKKTGEAEVRKVFDIKGMGVIAGCYVKDGIIVKDGEVSIWRGKQQVGTGKIRSLQREKKALKEIQAGFECAFIVDGFTEWQEGDRVECFIIQQIEQ